jgi:hypothetical protein
MTGLQDTAMATATAMSTIYGTTRRLRDRNKPIPSSTREVLIPETVAITHGDVVQDDVVALTQ